MLFLTDPMYLDEVLANLNKKPLKVSLATYGISSSLLPKTATLRSIGEALKTIKDGRALIGLNVLTKSTYLDKFKANYPNIVWKYSYRSHLKVWIFEFKNRKYPIVLTGGRNLTGSSWIDLSLRIEGKEALKILQYYDDVWVRNP